MVTAPWFSALSTVPRREDNRIGCGRIAESVRPTAEQPVCAATAGRPLENVLRERASGGKPEFARRSLSKTGPVGAITITR